MNRRAASVLFPLALAVICGVAWGASGGEEGRRRAAAAALLDSGSALVLRGPDAALRSNDVHFPYRQESNLLYLTGLNRPGVSLIIAPGGVPLADSTATAVLFVARPADMAAEIAGEGHDLLIRDAAEFPGALRELCSRITSLYAGSMQPGFVRDWLNNRPVFVERESRAALEKSFPSVKVKNAGTLIARLRMIKSEEEVGKIVRSIEATGEGLKHAMRICRPGMFEYELQAAIEFEMVRRGAQGPAFPSIVGSGPNSLILHYDDNARRMERGDVVVMDVGAEIDGYAADVTRTIPVSGKFTSEQRRVFDAVLRAQKAVIGVVKSGLPWAELDAAAKRSLAADGFDRYWKHSVSHHLGIDVHDVGRMDTLKPGMVITVEPGLYIPVEDTLLAPEYRGMGIRIEDDVLVTHEGPRVLSQGIPRDAASIERFMQTGRSR